LLFKVYFLNHKLFTKQKFIINLENSYKLTTFINYFNSCLFLVVAHKANPEEIRNFETANRYHFYHTFALFGVPFCRFPRIVSIQIRMFLSVLVILK